MRLGTVIELCNTSLGEGYIMVEYELVLNQSILSEMFRLHSDEVGPNWMRVLVNKRAERHAHSLKKH